LLVIFDCDGVLVDSEVIACELHVEHLKSCGVSLTVSEAISLLVGHSRTREIIESTYHVRLPDDYERTHVKRQRQIFAEALTPVKGVETLLKTLEHKAIASNGSMAKIRSSLKVTGLDSYFPERSLFSAETVERLKPDPALFLFACQAMGFPKEKAIVVDDSVAGLEAAAAAGIRCLAFAGASHFLHGASRDDLRRSGAIAVCDTVEDLKSEINRLDSSARSWRQYP
jgi:HAD superfamily hydrolase (TIGR01509 family)